MQVHSGQPTPWISYAITVAIILVVFALRWRKIGRVMPLKLERLWMLPALYEVIAVSLFIVTPPQGLGWLFCAVALGLGAALGWRRGKLMHIHVDPETHALNQKASPAAFAFIVVLLVVRMGAKSILTSGGGDPHLNAMLIADVLVALALGLFTATRVEMYLRAKRLLQAARLV